MERVEALTKARSERKWSLEQVAAEIGVDPSTVARWERGEKKPRPGHKQALERLYGKSAQELGLEKPVAAPERSPIEDENEEEDASLTFRNQHFFIRLVRIVWGWPTHAPYYELQMLIQQELEEQNTMLYTTRREALCLLASLPFEMPLLTARTKLPNEDLLGPVAAGITACWELRRGSELAFVASTVSKYIPILKEIAKSGNAQKQEAAADLLVQCYLLKSSLAIHVESNTMALRYAQIAERYCEQAHNPALHVLVARQIANIYDWAGRKKQALQAGLQAKYLLESKKEAQIPMLASHVYAGLADYQAQNGKTQDALLSLRKAHTSFFAQNSEDAPAPIWATNSHSQGALLLHDGLTHYYLGLHEKASDSFQQIAAFSGSSITTQIEALIDQVWAEVMREGPRNMEKCISLWKKGIQGAISIQSEAQYEDGMAAYTAMRAAWPGEASIKNLQDYAVHW